MSFRLYIIYLSAFVTGIALYQPAVALPVHQETVAGQINLTPSGHDKLNVHQATDKAIINWRNFDVAPHEVVNIHQPDSNAILLNRISAGDPTKILGDLNANGNVWLINPHGIMFGEQAQVNVGGLLASTANITDQNFLNGKYQFNQFGAKNGFIRNEGRIHADYGIVGLLAPSVSNNGTIHASFGSVSLAATDTFTVDFYGDGLLNIALDGINVGSATSEAYATSNSGNIIADAGKIEMTVAQGNALVERTIDHKWGVLQANSVGTNSKGQIVLGGGEKATTYVQGDINAQGKSDGEYGGNILITGNKVAIVDNAALDASGVIGGGTVKIGGDYQGKGEVETAERTYVDTDASIKANATLNGDGGRVIVWSDDRTDFFGKIEAKGGTQSGNGGFVETSGKQVLNMQGFVSTQAFNGRNGAWLLDPTNVTISNGGATDPAGGGCGGGPFTCNGFASIDANALELALDGGDDVEITTTSGALEAGNITLSDALSWTGTGSLTLSADNDIDILNTITSTNVNADLTLNAGGDGAGSIDIDADINIAGNFTATATGSSIGFDASVDTNGGDLTLNSPAQFNSTNHTLDAGSGTLTLGSVSTRRTTFGADTMVFNGAITTLGTWVAIRPGTNGETLGIGTGAAGTLNISDGMLALLADANDDLYFSTDQGGGGGDIDIHSLALARDLIGVQAGTGSITVDAGGIVTDAANTQLILAADAFNLNGTLAGTGAIRFEDAVSGGLGIGTGTAGGTVINDASLDNISNGWSDIVFDATDGDIEVAGRTWNDNVTIYGGQGEIIISGAQIMGANSLTFGTRNDYISLNAPVSGTGTLTFGTFGHAGNVGLKIGDDAIGNYGFNTPVMITDASLQQIQNGWTNIVFGGSSPIAGQPGATNDIAFDPTIAYEFSDPVTFSGNSDVYIDAPLIAAAGSDAAVTFLSSDSNTNPVRLNAAIDLSAGDGTGDVTFDESDLVLLDADITTGGGDIIFTNNVTATNLSRNTILNAGSGSVSIGTGGMNAGANNITFISDEFVLNGDLDGSGALIIRPSTNASTISLNDGNVAGLDFTAAELTRIGATTDFSDITIGGAAHTGVMNVGDWTAESPLTLQAGSVNLDGDVDVGARTLVVTANAGNIGYTSGTLTADTLNLDATGTITSNVNVTTALDIANNSTAATLTGLYQAGNTQTEADLITGGPGNDANYTFEGFTIRAVAAPAPANPPPAPVVPPPAPPSDPEPEPEPTPEPEPEPSPEPEKDINTNIEQTETVNPNVLIIESFNINNLSSFDLDGPDILTDGVFDYSSEAFSQYTFDDVTEGTAILLDKNGFTPIESGYIPRVGDHIHTGFDYGFIFNFDENAIVKMARNAEVKVKSVLFSPDGKAGKYIDVKKGAVGFFSDRKKHKGEIKTILPGIAIKVTGTCYIVDFDEPTQRTDIALFGGGIELYIKGQLIKLTHPIQMISFDGKAPDNQEKITPAKVNMQHIRNLFKDRPEVIPNRDQLLKCGVSEADMI